MDPHYYFFVEGSSISLSSDVNIKPSVKKKMKICADGNKCSRTARLDTQHKNVGMIFLFLFPFVVLLTIIV